MKAAVVSSFGAPPEYRDFPDPVPTGHGEVVLDVVAAGLHPRVRSQATGSHYTSTGELPLIPGVDGVGRGSDGLLRYFLLADTTRGSMAEQAVVDTRRSVVLPADCDPVAVAAGMNPAMSSWVALRQRVQFEAGQHVLILGATGNAGQLAVQIARLLGAGRIVAAGRNPERLAKLAAAGATDTVSLGGPADAVARELGRAARDVDVVIDYLWGEPTSAAMVAVITERTDRGKPLTWIEIGAIAGPTAQVPAAALRAARLTVVGSGVGSIGPHEYAAELPALAEEITAGALEVNARAVPLADVEQAWLDVGATERVVVTPQP
jgi:NADPH:quinone reductase-like Zn-dependent oxidoreductase